MSTNKRASVIVDGQPAVMSRLRLQHLDSVLEQRSIDVLFVDRRAGQREHDTVERTLLPRRCAMARCAIVGGLNDPGYTPTRSATGQATLPRTTSTTGTEAADEPEDRHDSRRGCDSSATIAFSSRGNTRWIVVRGPLGRAFDRWLVRADRLLGHHVAVLEGRGQRLSTDVAAHDHRAQVGPVCALGPCPTTPTTTGG